jgi:phospholipase C
LSKIDRRTFLRLTGATALASSLSASIAKALEIPANNRTGTIMDVEHIVILMQENRPFDHHFGTLRGVRGYADPRAVDIHLPLRSGAGTVPASVFFQPAGAKNVEKGFAVAPGTVGGPSKAVDVIPPFRVDPAKVNAGRANLGDTYMKGTDHGWPATHDCWNDGRYDQWAVQNGPMTMGYMTREDLPYHYALADAFTVGDAYFCSIMAPTNPNRCYMWTGCIGNVNYLGEGGTDGRGAGPVTDNDLSPNKAYFVWETLPELLEAAGISWKIYQDLAGQTFSPDFGDGAKNPFAGSFSDNPLLYFSQYKTAAPGTPLFDKGCTGTEIIKMIPHAESPAEEWKRWSEHLFDHFRNDVASGKLPQVSWIVAPAGYSEHADYPINYGAWYISQVFDILVSNPDLFSKTVFLINYDEADGSFDHIVPPTPPQTGAHGASTVSIENEILTGTKPDGPIGLGTRVPFLAISPWSKGGFVDSEVFDHTSIVQFIEKRFGVHARNISPWRRAVTGDLTSAFNFGNPNAVNVPLASTETFLPPVFELAGGNVKDFEPSVDSSIVGIPAQEKGIRPARAVPYQLDVRASVDIATSTIRVTFVNKGKKAAVFQVRSGKPADLVRNYTVGPQKTLADTWHVDSTYQLTVYGPNGFTRYFNGRIGSNAAVLDVHSSYEHQGAGSILLSIANPADSEANVRVLDAYTGKVTSQVISRRRPFVSKLSLDQFHGWYELIVTVDGDPNFKYRLAGHVETGRASYSDPALGGIVTLKA